MPVMMFCEDYSLRRLDCVLEPHNDDMFNIYLEDITQDLLKLDKEIEGTMKEILE
jgi:hypothetical protein